MQRPNRLDYTHLVLSVPTLQSFSERASLRFHLNTKYYVVAVYMAHARVRTQTQQILNRVRNVHKKQTLKVNYY